MAIDKRIVELDLEIHRLRANGDSNSQIDLLTKLREERVKDFVASRQGGASEPGEYDPLNTPVDTNVS